MSVTGVTALDHTIQEANVWLKGLEEELRLDNRQQAYSALRAVLHILRDRLPPEVAIKLGAQLPILVRGIYYENWHVAGTPTKERHVDDFVEHVAAQLPQQFPAHPLMVARGVFELLWQKLDPGEFEKAMHHLPEQIRALKA
ncbi:MULTISPECIES: DUF2267 domain-containing protein [unclassified Bradyrhizobium]|uniref:DUF2267 domain-containing protein n=1 Tax=unclassified Bradyrhizobium TaxID=2631580 RepID=UPI0028E7B2FC|nr:MULTISPECIES: DUF2267 domain-containing protein [unclassified Bradyrhizobium]